MDRCWIDKNIDLTLLATGIHAFLENYFKDVRKEDVGNGFKIFAERSPFFNSNEYIDVLIEGHPNNFTIKLNFCRKKKSGFIVAPLLLSIFGGGYLFLKRLKSQENWIHFENEFWRFIENCLLRLANSACRIS